MKKGKIDLDIMYNEEIFDLIMDVAEFLQRKRGSGAAMEGLKKFYQGIEREAERGLHGSSEIN